jgi:hypothetical protein
MSATILKLFFWSPNEVTPFPRPSGRFSVDNASFNSIDFRSQLRCGHTSYPLIIQIAKPGGSLASHPTPISKSGRSI